MHISIDTNNGLGDEGGGLDWGVRIPSSSNFHYVGSIVCKFHRASSFYRVHLDLLTYHYSTQGKLIHIFVIIRAQGEN